ncbi:MAG: type II CRISPR RNA-guided endonuclease Cas9, partial [Clostridia bacterium]|nr:type II CRISPR RNA-guided endonuclease Cas9 [Clostridia bacterium]
MGHIILTHTENKLSEKKYYLGIDAGTDSVGYAVTDEQYNLLKFHGEPMWGVTLFEEAQPSAERRSFRTSRRRTVRRRQRILLLQELFAHEIAKTDKDFFLRLNSTQLYGEDGEAATLFPQTGEYTDKIYHRQYPTVHHLIYDLMQTEEKRDVRLVYLALAWLIAHRGHFLSEINTDNLSELTDFAKVFTDLTDYIIQSDDTVVLPWENNGETIRAIGEILNSEDNVSGKYRKLCNLLFHTAKAPKEAEGFPYGTETFFKLLSGSTVKAADLFMKGDYAEIESFSLAADDNKLAEVFNQLGEDAELIIKMKAVFDCALLMNSLNGCSCLSLAKIKKYEQHKKDLKTLKYLIRTYAPQQFNDVFRSVQPNNYPSYSRHVTRKDRTPLKWASKEQFSDYLKKIVSQITPAEKDRELFEDVKNRVSLYTFLPKQTDSDNRVMPYQLYLWELREILSHAEAYLPFLKEKDENGLSVSEKVQSVFTFKIPYFVGPLNPYCRDHAWVKFKSNRPKRILPWNFSDAIDEDATEQEFIRRMTNCCSYLPCEDVLPKDSLLYHRFTVLNEINNLQVNELPITVEAKQGIYNDLFMTRRKVTAKAIKEYLIKRQMMGKNDILSGIDETVKSDLKPWLDFRRLMEQGALTEEQVEDIIEHRAYSSEKPRFVRWLKQHYGFLTEEDVTYISKLPYKDFGKLSRRLLNGIEGISKNSGTGEVQTIIGLMWETNDNLMKLLSERYTFSEVIQTVRKEYYAEHSLSLKDRMDELYLSPSVRRPVTRTLEIVKEISQAIGNPPAKIFVEMARGGLPEDKGKRTKSRYEQITELYNGCKEEDVRHL